MDFNSFSELKTKHISEHFTQFELVYSARYPHLCILPSKEILEKATEFAENILEVFRKLLGAPMRVNSWWRNPRLNQAISTEDNSVHQIYNCDDEYLGVAADIPIVKGWKIWDMMREAILIPGLKGAIIYPRRNFIHLDTAKKRKKLECYVSNTKNTYTPISLDQILSH